MNPAMSHLHERVANSVRSLSPFGERVGVRGLPVVGIDPNLLTHSSMVPKESSPLPSELGLARVRHFEVGRSRINPTSAGERARAAIVRPRDMKQ
jgi:hypothetical protein